MKRRNLGTLVIDFGALVPSISDQLFRANLTAPDGNVYKWQKIADAIVNLLIWDVLSDSEARRARQRLLKIMGAIVRPVSK